MGALLRAFWGIVPVAVIVVSQAVCCWPMLATRRRRRGTDHAVPTSGVDIALVVLGVLVLLVVTMPVGTENTSTLDLTPGADLADAFADGSWWQVIGNLLLLLPLGALLPLRVRRLRSSARIAIAALAVSVLVETVQYVIHAGRVTSTDDVLLNTLGATIGAALTRPWWRIFDHRPVPRIPQQIRRVCEAPVQLHRAPQTERYARLSHPDRR
ncbi:VanZ family protein [Amycolatopsis jejuensis]|uniref:VanZ family protein n=1 Tax=Amycolatopsis jejuensis TaxID=330084 RepID=UPI0005241650|nr:VanZ family protein [Amycolatopsis jejuensis]